MARPWIRLTPIFDGENQTQFVLLTCRVFFWPTMRRVATRNGVDLEERRVGLITKQFTCRGTTYRLERFVNQLCDEDPSLYDKIMAHA